MKILVDALPEKCGDCQFCVDAFMMSPLGVQKQVNICTITASLIPQDPQMPPKTINKEDGPFINGCLFTDGKDTSSRMY